MYFEITPYHGLPNIRSEFYRKDTGARGKTGKWSFELHLTWFDDIDLAKKGPSGQVSSEEILCK